MCKPIRTQRAALARAMQCLQLRISDYLNGRRCRYSQGVTNIHPTITALMPPLQGVREYEV